MLLFLDLDGVLRRTGSPLYRLEAELVERFESTVRSLPDLRIVISSNWREGFTLDEIRSHFSDDIAGRIVGTTPIAQEPGGHTRYLEVLAYLRRNGTKPEPWVAIDDDPLHYPETCNVVLLDGARGFDPDAATRFAEAVGAPPPTASNT